MNKLRGSDDSKLDDELEDDELDEALSISSPGGKGNKEEAIVLDSVVGTFCCAITCTTGGVVTPSESI
ncbi:hypothetical protein FACS1894122_05550 [Alphaproteobacteria bacterium]|nr:hypothetical protein FACS1894122_05550 [Alphaproteobacteria bacterium]